MAEVKIYTTPTCVYCDAAKRFFNEHDVEYEEYDVSQDRERAIEMIHKSGQMGVPVIEIDGEVIIGFDKPRIAQALGISG
ncbi:MAG: glutaredoxin family protein [Candidatus Bipolaricaulia bacterium]